MDGARKALSMVPGRPLVLTLTIVIKSMLQDLVLHSFMDSECHFAICVNYVWKNEAKTVCKM